MGQRIHRGREGWAKLVRRQEESGQSARAFCVGESINLTSFYKWRGRIRGEVRGEAPKGKVFRNEFFEVGRIDTQDDVMPNDGAHPMDDVMPNDGAHPMEVKLDFGDGFTLTVHRG